MSCRLNVWLWTRLSGMRRREGPARTLRDSLPPLILGREGRAYKEDRKGESRDTMKDTERTSSRKRVCPTVWNVLGKVHQSQNPEG